MSFFSSLQVQNHRACNIKYRDLFRIFETLMNATCVEEKVAESFPITMVTNSFRAYLNEFRNSVSAKMKEKEEEKKRRKKPNKKSKRDKDVLVSISSNTLDLSFFNCRNNNYYY